MNKKSYFSIHNHTDYSNIKGLDSTIKVEELINNAIEMGLNGCAITDHETFSGHIEALNVLKKRKNKNFKLVLGNEIYLTRNNLSKETVNKKEKYWHFLILAKDKKGHDQLRKLSSIAWSENYFRFYNERVPTFYKNLEEVVGKEKGHLIASTACLGSEFANRIMMAKNNPEEKEKLDSFVNWCLDLFGNDFYIELQPSNTIEQIEYNKEAIVYADKKKVPLIITTDSHYLNKKDREIHKAFLKSNNSEREVDSFYSSTYMMNWEEIKEYCPYIPEEKMEEIRKNTLNIFEKCESYNLDNSQKIPRVPQKQKYKVVNFEFKEENKNYAYINKYISSPYEEDVIFINKLLISLKKYCAGKSESWISTRKNRLEEELAELWETSVNLDERVSAYFTTMERIMEIAWEEVKTIVGPGRGSVFGMLTAFLLGIIQEDPLNNPIDPPFWRLTLVSLM